MREYNGKATLRYENLISWQQILKILLVMLIFQVKDVVSNVIFKILLSYEDFQLEAELKVAVRNVS